jgi:chorismate synthase
VSIYMTGHSYYSTWDQRRTAQRTARRTAQRTSAGELAMAAGEETRARDADECLPA